MKSTYVLYTGIEELVFPDPILGDPASRVEGTLEDAKLAALDLWNEMEEVFEADIKIDPDWGNSGDITYADSPFGYWVAIKPTTIKEVK